MRIAIIGPAHPYKGGIVQHTTELAHRLTAAGHEVEIISWSKQYPFFYPGKQFVDEPELPAHGGTHRALSWRNPLGWAKWGRKLRSFDRLVFIWWVPTFQGPPYLGMLKALGRKRPPTVLICHNVLPHEPKPGDKQLAKAMLKRSDHIIVHSQAQADIVSRLTDKSIVVAELPLPVLKSVKKTNTGINKELLFFGFIRPYKGVDVLLKAMVQVPDVKLTIAGEVWGDPEQYTSLIDELGLGNRVDFQSGYIPSNKLAQMVADTDAVILPYRSGTGSWNVHVAHAYGVPVIATKVGSLHMQVKDGVDGLLCEPDNAGSLAKTIKHFYEPGVAEKLRQGVPEVSIDQEWQSYVQAVTSG